MAKESMKAREARREKTVAKYAVKRAALKATIKDPSTSPEDTWTAQIALQKLPKDASPVRMRLGKPRARLLCVAIFPQQKAISLCLRSARCKLHQQ